MSLIVCHRYSNILIEQVDLQEVDFKIVVVEPAVVLDGKAQPGLGGSVFNSGDSVIRLEVMPGDAAQIAPHAQRPRGRRMLSKPTRHRCNVQATIVVEVSRLDAVYRARSDCVEVIADPVGICHHFPKGSAGVDPEGHNH